MVLSDVVKESGILAVIANFIEHHTHGMPLWSITAIFAALVLVCTTFVSHTVGAMVILPIVETVGKALPEPHPRLLVMSTALMCSGAMGLPVSGARWLACAMVPSLHAVALPNLEPLRVLSMAPTCTGSSGLLVLG